MLLNKTSTPNWAVIINGWNWRISACPELSWTTIWRGSGRSGTLLTIWSGCKSVPWKLSPEGGRQGHRGLPHYHPIGSAQPRFHWGGVQRQSNHLQSTGIAERARIPDSRRGQTIPLGGSLRCQRSHSKRGFQPSPQGDEGVSPWRRVAEPLPSAALPPLLVIRTPGGFKLQGGHQ